MDKMDKMDSIFEAEPIGDKPATSLTGIGAELGKRLAEAGYEKAYTVVGQYLVLKKDTRLFTFWLMDEFKATKKQANDCYECIREYCDQFM